MTKRYLLLAACLAGLGSDCARAVTYADTDLLLVFRRDGFNDVLFNLGSVSNYLDKAQGTRIPVTNWDASLVAANFAQQWDKINLTLQAATTATDASRRVWVTDAVGDNAPQDISGSLWSQIRSKISFTGLQAQTFTGTNATQAYTVSPSDPSAYTYLASNGGLLDVATLGGLAAFPVEAPVPADLRFFELKTSNQNPKPAALQAGVFSIDATGTLTFIAGVAQTPSGPVPPPTILGIQPSGAAYTISCTTTNGASYQLVYNTGDLKSWQAAGTALRGTGEPLSFTDTPAGSIRFYAIQTSW